MRLGFILISRERESESIRIVDALFPHKLLLNSSMLLKTSEIKAKIKTFTCLLPHKAEVAEFSITKVVLFSTAEV